MHDALAELACYQNIHPFRVRQTHPPAKLFSNSSSKSMVGFSFDFPKIRYGWREIAISSFSGEIKSLQRFLKTLK